MKSEHPARIKQLLDKYDLGQTSLEEEDILIIFFASEEIPNEFHPYKDEFHYYSAFRQVSFHGLLGGNIQTNPSTILQKISQFLSKWFGLSGLLILAGLSILFVYQHLETEEIQDRPVQKESAPSTDFRANSDSSIHEEIRSQVEDSILLLAAESLLPKKGNPPTTDRSEKDTHSAEPVLSVTHMEDSSKAVLESRDTSVTIHSTAGNIEDLRSHIPIADIGEQKEVTFHLMENSSSGELAKIAHLAQQAGIEYTYVVDQHKKKIHELNIVMIIPGTGKRSQLWISVPKKSSFSEVLSWTVDTNGNAVSLCESNIEHKVRARHPLD